MDETVLKLKKIRFYPRLYEVNPLYLCTILTQRILNQYF